MIKPSLLFITPVVRDRPTTGGELYTLHLVRALSASWELHTLTYADLGVDNRAPAGAFTGAVLDAIRRMGHNGPILEDSIIYRVGAPLNRRLHEEGLGPIIGFGQAAYHRRATTPMGRFARMLFLRRYLVSCDAHIVVSAHLASLQRRLRVNLPTAVVRPGFDLLEQMERYVRPETSPEHLRLITAGVYIPAKGQHLLLKAVRSLAAARPATRARLTVECYGHQYADGAYYRSLTKFVERHDLGRMVQLNAQVPQTELWLRMAACDAFVFIASGEGFGMVVGESMLLGCTPVVSKGEPMAEMLDDGVSGVSVRPRSNAIARVIEALLDDAEARSRMSSSARTKALSFARAWPETEYLFGRELDRLIGAAGG